MVMKWCQLVTYWWPLEHNSNGHEVNTFQMVMKWYQLVTYWWPIGHIWNEISLGPFGKMVRKSNGFPIWNHLVILMDFVYWDNTGRTDRYTSETPRSAATGHCNLQNASSFSLRVCTGRRREDISAFMLALRKLSGTCDYGNFHAQVLRDRLFCGLKDPSIQKVLWCTT